jgi:hypothetical protein
MGGATPSHVIFRSDLMKIKFIQNIRKQLCMDLTIITQLYCQLYITHQLHVLAKYYFWPSSGWIQLSEKTTQYIKGYSITISVGVSRGGRDLVYKRVGGRVCTRFNMQIYTLSCYVYDFMFAIIAGGINGVS